MPRSGTLHDLHEAERSYATNRGTKAAAYVRGRRWNVTFPVRPPGNDVSNEHEGTRRRDAPAPNSVRRGSIDPVDGEQINEKTEKKREKELGDLGGWLRRACTHARTHARTHACLRDDKFVIANLYNWHAGFSSIRHWGPTNLWLMSLPPLPYVSPSVSCPVKK